MNIWATIEVCLLTQWDIRINLCPGDGTLEDAESELEWFLDRVKSWEAIKYVLVGGIEIGVRITSSHHKVVDSYIIHRIILVKMILRDITVTSLLFSDLRRLDAASCIIWHWPCTVTSEREAITLVDEILSSHSQGGEITMQKRGQKSEEILSPMRTGSPPKSTQANYSPKEL